MAVVACTPHPGLGTVVYRHVAVNLATCKTAPAPAPLPSSGPRAVGGTIVFHGRVVVRVAHKGDSVWLDGTSPDGKWILYAIDRFSSASLAADGLPVRADPHLRRPFVSHRDRPRLLELSELVRQATRDDRGLRSRHDDAQVARDRIAADLESPDPCEEPTTRVRLAHVRAGRRDRPVDATASDEGFRSPHWSLWHVGWMGNLRRLTAPPKGVSDESPKDVGSVLYFVRSGSLYALRERPARGTPAPRSARGPRVLRPHGLGVQRQALSGSSSASRAASAV